ncbi:hypothetical protein KC717_02680 [Candidatus Dojkabacteria bacterium]|uniref:Band 7 domain-containing protein n=1 Tax=Candidatus Dojkabacteria bacterium TaxID=2099670 RepID=A0A955RKM3_9BACT|nr:hypothetical protein [Candidatus Dojkabacteria bacterium]
MSTKGVQTFIRGFIFVLSFLGLLSFSFVFTQILNLNFLLIPAAFIDFILASVISKMFYVLPEWQRLVLLRLGKYSGTKGPGVFIIFPFIYSVASIIDIRITTHQVEATATLTKDNVPTRVTAAIELEIEDPKKAILNVQNYFNTVTWLATEALKNTIGSMDLKELLSNRDEIADNLKQQIDSEAQQYGINVRAVRITDIDTPPELVEELAVIARAHRAAQAKQIQAEAEIMVAEKVAQATQILSKTPGGFKLREIQNLAEIAKEESSMIIVYPESSAMGADIASSAIAMSGQQVNTTHHKTKHT